ncbi:tannase/feruloyl esterase family alpha/beta hydrolase [Kibdelosporangium lantanae]|uniref:Tannase/feruloyl esterase family alpha/beta hydrolase n=1 Tax=Kibdelosporangium lantanae TaxID=1497396 RepID=A0ABW3M8G5_9PSEU
MTDVPPYCSVSLVLTHPGANDRVTLSVWLPVSGWNGRFQGTGGGGYAMTQGDTALAQAVKDGYAAAGTDGGHVNDFEDPSTWALGSDGHVNQALLLNFASRSLHEMAVGGKAVATSYYGRAPRYSYWTGCSTGGRQGLMEAQRYPDDYDGISANAPAVNWDRFIPDLVWPQVVMQQEHNFPTQCEFQAFHDAATAACDRNDGVADGVVDLPDSCDYSPYRLVGTKIVCDGKEITISRADADVVHKIWQGTPLWYGLNRTAPFGSIANTAVGPDGTVTGVPFGISANWLRYFVQEDPSFDLRTVTYRDFDRLFAKSRARFNQVIGTDDPDLSAFRAAGGKMITWHGIDDSIIPYQGTVDYRQRVDRRMGGTSTVDNFYRVFLTPGVDHCGFAGSQGNFQLNVMLPVIARNVLESARLIAAVARLLADKVLAGTEVDVERAREYAESSPSIVTPLNKYIGYEEAASIAKQSLKERRTIRDVVIERGHVESGKLTLEQLDEALDVLRMARGGTK